MSLIDFVNSLFDNIKEPGKQGIHIRMENDEIFTIKLFLNRDMVEVTINGVVMGVFQEMDAKGYKYKFDQKYRVGIRKGLTLKEYFIKNVCQSNSYILFHPA